MTTTFHQWKARTISYLTQDEMRHLLTAITNKRDYALVPVVFRYKLRHLYGRNAGYPAPPVQTRTCSFPASGSSVVLASAVQSRAFRHTRSDVELQEDEDALS